MYIYIYVRKEVLQWHKLDTATVAKSWWLYLAQNALQPRSMLFGGFCSEAFLLQEFRSLSIGFHCSRRAPSPTLLCTGAMRSGQPFSICIVCKFTLRSLHLYKCWITLCWFTKCPSKDNLLLPLLTRKRDNRQRDGKTIGKATVRLSWRITPFLLI